MILISLMLAATPAPAVSAADVQRRQAPRPRPTRPATRSKRLIELEAAVKSLPLAAADPVPASGPQGM
ncbi:MAG TPA: hypothetical protein VF759_13385 [Allosphingosinicella sp.]|jgi:hypothetical protein